MATCAKSMARRLIMAVGGLVAVVGVAGAVWFAGMRTKWPPVIDLQRRVNRRVVNPRQMRTAGSPGAYAGVIRHVGRRTGTEYATPVVPFPRDDKFVIVLPYGSRPDWVKNVLAAGSAELTHEGFTFTVGSPVLRAVAPEDLPTSELRTMRMFGTTECLELTRFAG